MSLLASMISPATSTISPRNSTSSSSRSNSDSPRQSIALESGSRQGPESTADCNNVDQSLPPLSTSNITPASSIDLPPTSSPIMTPVAQKRRSLAQSFRNSMMSLSQLLSPAASLSTSPVSSPALSGPAHYNVLVLGSDSAPLASTIYKMSGVLPKTTKIQHYQEISGFFVAHFRSNDDSPPSPWRAGVEEVKSRRQSLQEFETPQVGLSRRSTSSSAASTRSASKEGEQTETLDDETTLPSHFKEGYDLINATTKAKDLNAPPRDSGAFTSIESNEPPAPVATLSIHAFSLDTTWPVPRTLAQTFWFPHAHGIIYIVDATRKNDPRGMDHLLNARQFLNSLVSDPHFKRKDIPVVVFANKAGCDPETCYRLDEVAEILGCEDWDLHGTGGVEQDPKTGLKRSRPWSIKSTRTDGEGNGIRESVEWLKSRMSEVWSP
ncbi:hypothetical protein BGX34_007154 [Mortierella sp. NVP85]|nr:hypothetical protein BGX34_007154 [Mortierella sp. NVP85]